MRSVHIEAPATAAPTIVGAGRGRRTRPGLGAVLALAAMLSGCSIAGPQLPTMHGSADPEPPSLACGQRYELASRVELPPDVAAPEAVRRAFAPARVWGVAENVRILGHKADGTPTLAVRYPKGSIAPSSAAPRGGAGFVSRAGLGGGAEAACLSYRVRFADDFAFARGGKLPGLYGGDGPVGGATTAAGFSARLMWRQDGLGELYAYLPGQTADLGRSLGRGAWRFPVGRWVTVEQEIVLNDPGTANGIARIWIAGELRFEARDLIFRPDQELRIEGLMFSTFFGGHDPSWASPKDQEAHFADFAVHLPRPSRTLATLEPAHVEHRDAGT